MALCEDLLKVTQQLTSETCLMKKISSLNDVLLLLQNSEVLSESFSSNYLSANELVETLVAAVLIKELNALRDRDYEKKDFMGTAEAAEAVLKCIGLLLPFVEMDSKCIAAILVLCATYGEDFMWSSQKNVALSKDLISKSCVICGFENIHHLLVSPKWNPSVFRVVLEKLKPSIENKNWKYNPSTVPIFKWFLLRITHPHLSAVFSQVLSFSLCMVDNYRSETKIQGVECIHHIVKNVPQAHLKTYGWSDVIYDALHRLAYEREPEMVEVVYPCLLSFLQATEKNLNKADRPLEAGRYSEIFSNLLVNMAHEQRITLRRAYSKQLPAFIDSLRITICRQLKRTVLVLCEYLTTYDSEEEETRIHILNALNCLIVVSWPRLSSHYEVLLKSLLQLLYDTVMTPRKEMSKAVKNSVISNVTKCLTNLKLADEKKFMVLMNDVTEMEIALPVVRILQSVIKKSE